VVGGPQPPEDLPTGFYVRPTILADVTTDMAVAREEIFGPVICVMSFHDAEDALRIANATDYGLAGAVWAADDHEAVAFARRMDTGQVDINGGRFNLAAPFGGYKASGVGRELGRFGLEEYLQTKSLQFRV
jgi:aldehyde dehydrogenase (NAD+)